VLLTLVVVLLPAAAMAAAAGVRLYRLKNARAWEREEWAFMAVAATVRLLAASRNRAMAAVGVVTYTWRAFCTWMRPAGPCTMSREGLTPLAWVGAPEGAEVAEEVAAGAAAAAAAEEKEEEEEEEKPPPSVEASANKSCTLSLCTSK